jgi:hypothetical protein
MVVNRCRSADYVQRFGHHANDIRAAVAVRFKIEAFKVTQKKMKLCRVYIFKTRLCFMIELFSSFYC